MEKGEKTVAQNSIQITSFRKLENHISMFGLFISRHLDVNYELHSLYLE